MKHLKPDYKVGDYVKCISGNGYGKSLTIGRTYKILRIDKKRDSYFVHFLDNNGNYNGAYAKRFKRATVKNTAIARAFYKNRIVKIKDDVIHLKGEL